MLECERPRPRTAASGLMRVRAPARLHLGFLDPGATLGRPFGSLGLVIAGQETVVELGRSDVDRFESLPAGAVALARARAHVETLRRATQCYGPVRLRVRSALPAHVGLGSGTQLALAVGRAFCAAFELALTTPQLAALLGRGGRSGVGVAGFDQGGLLLDGGPQSGGAPALVLARLAMPAAWRALLVLDPGAHGLSGPAEEAALARLAPLPRAAAAAICHEVLMRILPGAAAAEFTPFAAGLSHMQQVLGAHYAPVQHGRAFTSEAVGRLLHWIADHAVAGIGQSSWGPTGFAFLPSQASAREVLAAAGAAGAIGAGLQIHVIGARNHGAMLSNVRTGG